MSRVILIEVEARRADLLRAGCPATDTEFLQADSPIRGIALVEQEGEAVGAVVLGRAVAEPVRTAQRVYARQPDVAVLILTDRPCAELARALAFAPFVGEDVHCHDPDDDPLLCRHLQAALLRTAARRQKRALGASLRLLLGQPDRSQEGMQAAYYLGRIFDQAPIGVVIIDGDDRILSLNVRAGTLFEKSERDLLGTPLPSFFPADEQQKWPPLLAQAGVKPSAQQVLSRTDQTGAEQVLDLTVSPLHIGQGSSGHLVLVNDVTSRVRAEREQEHLSREAIRVRDEFISMASHELRTPMTPLRLQLQVVRQRLQRQAGSLQQEVAADLMSRMDALLRHTERMGKLIDHLLDTSRITAGRLDLHPEELDLSALSREVVVRFAQEGDQAGCTLTLAAPAPVIGCWDRVRVEQIVTNLLGNAIKYGAGAPIEVSVSATDESACLLVRDHGIGIPHEHLGRIFDRFERATSGRNYGGFGLGLWIVGQIVKAMGGTVSVDSQQGSGSTFRVQLPLALSRKPVTL